MRTIQTTLIIIACAFTSSICIADDKPNYGNNKPTPFWAQNFGNAPDKFTLKRGGTTILVYLPESLVNQDAPPFWLKVCRYANSSGDTKIRIDKKDNAGFSNEKCMYVGFKQSVEIETDANDSPEVEMQFLGRY